MVDEKKESIKQLASIADSLGGIDTVQFFRSSIGEASLDILPQSLTRLRKN